MGFWVFWKEKNLRVVLVIGNFDWKRNRGDKKRSCERRRGRYILVLVDVYFLS